MLVLSWNIRGVGSSASVNYLKSMIRQHKPFVVGILKQKQPLTRMAEFANDLCFSNFAHGHLKNTHIWVFWNSHIDLSDFHSLLGTMESKLFGYHFFYARCLWIEREELLVDIRRSIPLSMPWIIGGDFNKILNNTEK